VRYHQNITIDGKDIPAAFTNRKNSLFFNEKKWDYFIKPLLPEPKGRTFIEIGCNVGLYLRMATEMGFERVVGVEREAPNCRMAVKYRDANGHSYKVLNRMVGRDFDFDEMPAADVVLLSNMHYYIPMDKFMPFLDRLIGKTIYCIVVSRKMRTQRHGYPRADVEPIQRMFKGWNMERLITTTDSMVKDDPHRRRVHSMLFKGPLERRSVTAFTTNPEPEMQQELIDIVRGKKVELEDTLMWKFWQHRKQVVADKDKWTDRRLRLHVEHRLDVVRSIMENGMREPILAWKDHPPPEVVQFGIDGGNRAQILKLLGRDSIIVRSV